LALCVLPLFAACTTMPNGRYWGEDVTVRPGWSRLGEAAVAAATRPSFWAPLVAAGATQIDGWDRRISNWARRDTPVFGSQTNAADWSDYLRSASVVAGWTSIVVAPSGPFGEEWFWNKVKGSAVDVVAAEVAIESTSGLKRLTKRERPNGYDDQSMPSDHTATSAVYTRLAADNLELSGFDERIELGADITLGALTVATGWARVEAGAHFPSDTLVGASIGNFFADFFTAAFLAAPESRVRAQLQSIPGGATLQWHVAF
jgi:membrane-associated phospholipid phosphatase